MWGGTKLCLVMRQIFHYITAILSSLASPVFMVDWCLFPPYVIFLRIACAMCVWLCIRLFVCDGYEWQKYASCLQGISLKRYLSLLAPPLYRVCMSVKHVYTRVVVVRSLYVSPYLCIFPTFTFVLCCAFILFVNILSVLRSHLWFTHSRYVASACICSVLICCSWSLYTWNVMLIYCETSNRR